MSITPREPADFTPSRGNYTELKPFRFWCQKVLPLVYDDSLSYYELLCKVVDFLNKTMEDVETLEGDVTGLHTAYVELQAYVNEYFESLDVQEEIDNKLDEMVESGELITILQPDIANEVTEWLNENITPTSPPIDKTLSVDDAAANSKTVGDMCFIKRGRLDKTNTSGTDDFMNLEYGSYMVVGLSPNYFPFAEGVGAYGVLNVFKTLNGYNCVLYCTTDRLMCYRHFTILNGNRTWNGDWVIVADKAQITSDIANLSNIVFKKYGMLNKSNTPNTDAFMDLSFGSYMVVGLSPNYFPFAEGVGAYGVLNVFETLNGYNCVLYCTVDGLMCYRHFTVLNGNKTWNGDWQKVLTESSDRIVNLKYQGKGFICSEKPVYWNLTEQKIESESNIYCVIPNDSTKYLIAEATNGKASISVGANNFVYYYKNNNSVTTSVDYVSVDGLYLLATKYHEIDYKAIQSFAGKTCACFGDSITWYDGHAYTWGKAEGEIAVGYETWLRKKFGLTVINAGISGATAPEISEKIKITDLTNVDIITLTSGANDERHNTPLGNVLEPKSNFDTSTFCGALQSAIEFVLTNKPEMKIILITPLKGWIYEDGYDETDYPLHPSGGDISDKWANAIKRIGEMYGLVVCDWFSESGINELNRTIYINDPEPPTNNLYSLHPTSSGYKRISEILIDTFRKIEYL